MVAGCDALSCQYPRQARAMVGGPWSCAQCNRRRQVWWPPGRRPTASWHARKMRTPFCALCIVQSRIASPKAEPCSPASNALMRGGKQSSDTQSATRNKQLHLAPERDQRAHWLRQPSARRPVVFCKAETGVWNLGAVRKCAALRSVFDRRQLARRRRSSCHRRHRRCAAFQPNHRSCRCQTLQT